MDGKTPMRKIVLILALLLFVSPAFAWEGTVVKVSDGDTVWVEAETQASKIRLFGIDAPESNQPYGAEATAFLTDLALGKTVTVIELDTDEYGRSVANVILDERSLQEIMLEAGYAWVYPQYCKNCEEWQALQDKAIASQLGLWADLQSIPPWEWRQLNKQEIEPLNDVETADAKPVKQKKKNTGLLAVLGSIFIIFLIATVFWKK